MAKRKKTIAEDGEEGILDILGIGGDAGGEKPEKKPADVPDESEKRITALMSTIEGLTGRVEQMQTDFTRLATGGAAPITTPDAPKMAEITMEGLPDQTADPEGFTKGLNQRLATTMQENMAALSAHQAQSAAAAQAASARGDRLWSDFQAGYFEKLEADLPDTVSDVTPYVETAAKAVAAKAIRGISDSSQKTRILDNLMYGTPAVFMEDVFKEADRVLSPLRVKSEGEGEGEGPTPEEVAAANAGRTAGIVGAGGGAAAGKKPEEKKSTLVDDIQEIQRATGFF